ncbi:MAG: c-type cytochrome [Rhodospirillales bacterium]
MFAENCASCHGDLGKGEASRAPDLTDQIWLYGGGKAAIVSQITKPKLG